MQNSTSYQAIISVNVTVERANQRYLPRPGINHKTVIFLVTS